jgi:hypothetical protein
VLSSLLIACICNYKVKALASQVSTSAYGSLVRFCHTGTQVYGGTCGDSMRWSRHEERIYHVIAGGSCGCLSTPPTNRFASGTYTNRIITMGAKYVLPPHIFLLQETPQSRDLDDVGLRRVSRPQRPLFLSIICIVAVPFLIIREMFKPIDQRKAQTPPGPRNIPIFGSLLQFHKARRDSAQLFQ